MTDRLDTILAFGPFKLAPLKKTLSENDVPLRVGSRALDILVLLVEQSGQVVTKDEILKEVWPGAVVEEANLRVNIAALRKTLGDGLDGRHYIVNMPGKGYCFTAPVTRLREAGSIEPHRLPTASASNLPPHITRIIGRDQVVTTIADLFQYHRFVTIVGPGGMGKTTVALAIAPKLAGRYEDGVRFVDLAPLADPRLVSTAFASALGLSITSDNPLPGVIAYLSGKSMLIVLDNCEHVIAAAALLAEDVLKGAPKVGILATSREALRAEGEWVHRLAPMESPKSGPGMTADIALKSPAVQLFVERAAAVSDSFELSDENAPIVADLCRQLDGLPLAIELAAARVNLFGVHALAARLDDRMLLLTDGRRTALPRHQALQATLDWSYDLLTQTEQAVLRSVSIFKATFGMESAIAVGTSDGIAKNMVMDGIASLAEKSLLQVDVSGPAVRCRLLDSTRAYAFGKLRDSGDLAVISSRHAERVVELLTQAEGNWDDMSTPDWVALYGPMIDDIRAALHWSLSPEGNAQLVVELTTAAVPLWMHLSLLNECRETVATALEKADQTLWRSRENTQRHMKLLTALGVSMIYTKGPGPQIEDALNMAFALATSLQDTDYQLRAVWGLFVATFNEGKFSSAVMRAEIFRKVAANSANPSDIKAGDRLLGFALHMLGRQAEAREYVEGMLTNYRVPTRRSDLVRFQYDQRVAARVPLSAILFLQGYPDQAMENARLAVEEARSIDHALSLGYALGTAACPTALLVGDLAAAERFVLLLADHSAAHGLGPWSAWGRYFQSILAARRGQSAAGIQGVAAALAELRNSGFVLRFPYLLSEYADLLGKAGRANEGLIVIGEAQSRCERGIEIWCLPEVLRIKGELLLAQAPHSRSAADQLFRNALELARCHGMRAWELRTAISLARLRQASGNREDGYSLLSEIYADFTEGFESPDLIQARELLRTLSVE